MDIVDIGNKLQKAIPNSQFASGRKELVIRCPFCGHTSSPGKRHMYIGLSKDNPIMYNCFKCEAGGIVNKKLLTKLNIDPVLMDEIGSFNKSKMKSKSNSYSSNSYGDINIDYTSFDINQNIIYDKVSYINNRLGTNLSIDEMMYNKIIFDFSFFKRHIMGKLRATESDFQRIQKDYVGFLSVNNTSLTLRCIRNNYDKRYRYLVVKLYDIEDYNKAYSIPVNIPITTDRVLVNISEGQFDILSIYHNMMNKANGLYIAAAGNKYISVLDLIISKGIMNMDLHLYFDNDEAGNIAQRQMEYFIKNNRIFFSSSQVFFHMNRFPGEKDFGVNKDKINDFCVKIL